MDDRSSNTTALHPSPVPVVRSGKQRAGDDAPRGFGVAQASWPSGWFIVDQCNSKTVPKIAGVYVIYDENGDLSYIGSGENVRARLHAHGCRHSPYKIIKVRLSRRYGDWLMREARLIRRLQPPKNVRGCPGRRRRPWGGQR